MKKSITYSIVLMLFALIQSACNNGTQAAETAETKDSATLEKIQYSNSYSQEDSGEKMEKQNGMYDPSDIAKYWSKRTITVPGQKSDIVALFEAFYAEWPTHEGNRIVHMTNPSLAPKDEYFEEGSVIDRKNGYVESAWYEGEHLGGVSACIWNRKNGHKLFAVNFEVENDFLCFYDFDPAKRTLTPEASPIKKEHLNFPDKKPLWYTLPQEGKTLEVVEKGPDDNIASTYYEFDGQNLKFAGHDN